MREDVFEDVQRLGEKDAEELAKKLSDYVREDPEGCLKLFKAYMGGVRRGYKKLYDAQRLQLRITISPKDRLLFEACREFAFSKNWIRENSNRAFLRFCVETVLKNIWRQLKKEDEQLLREGKV